jgi:UDP-hydrolysing UDP-N-acetyl-D-glucosamine 2-epimerase
MNNKKKKICVVTTARSDYGLLYWLMKEIERDRQLRLQLIVSGMHLEPEFGNTYSIIGRDGFKINKKIPLSMKGDDAIGASRSLSKGFLGFAKAYSDLKPDLVVVLGDRYELIPPVATAILSNIPVAHIHGGEVTEGAEDCAWRRPEYSDCSRYSRDSVPEGYCA